MVKLLLIALILIDGFSKEPIKFKTTLIERDGVFYTFDLIIWIISQLFVYYLDFNRIF